MITAQHLYENLPLTIARRRSLAGVGASSRLGAWRKLWGWEDGICLKSGRHINGLRRRWKGAEHRIRSTCSLGARARGDAYRDYETRARPSPHYKKLMETYETAWLSRLARRVRRRRPSVGIEGDGESCRPKRLKEQQIRAKEKHRAEVVCVLGVRVTRADYGRA